MEQQSGTRKHRDHTTGENIFDWTVYGFINWVVNAVISVAIIDQFYNGHLRGFAEKATQIVDKINPSFLYKNPAQKLKYSKMAFFIAATFSGGTLLLLPIRWMESHKAEWVRTLDRWVHGKKTDTDPRLIEAHEEMDHAPQQSWGSLLQARGLGFVLGLGLGPLIGSADALSTRPFKNGFLSKLSSFKRAGATLSRGFWEKMNPNLSHEIRAARATSGFEIAAHENRRIKIGDYAVYDLLQSAIIASTFYITSKMFASWRDHRKEIRAEHEIEKRSSSFYEIAQDEKKSATDEKPSEKITSFRREVDRMNHPIEKIAALG